MKKLALLTLGATTALALANVPAATANTVTIGSPLTASFTSQASGAVGTAAMTSGPNIPSPVDGTIVRWRLSGFSGGPFRLRVLRLGPGGVATGDGTGPPFTIPVSTSPVDQTLSLPIKKGEVVGWDNSHNSDQIAVVSASPTYSGAAWVPPLADGETRSPFVGGGIEYAYQTTVRFCLVPSLKGKKLKKAKAALAAADCALGKVKKKKGSKGKFVRSQSIAPGSQISDTVPVGLRIGKRKK